LYLIVGLGNPGPKYAFTRHNVGFLALDMFAESMQIKKWQESHKGLFCKNKIDDQEVILLKPLTYMNKSGESVSEVINYYKVELDKLLVVHDEIELPFGKTRFAKNRGAAGNNGIKSINELLGTQDYSRLRMGIGRPTNPEFQIADYVLQKFPENEQSNLTDFLNLATDAIECFIFEGLSAASTKFNT
jgi:PTH1 family peptidyl-tRNA hydrolase